MFDYHIHTIFSADCSVAMEDMVESAIQVNLKEICFTDHYDQDYKDPTMAFELDIENYFKKMDYIKNEYKDKIIIKKGIELGVQPHILEDYEELVNKSDLDFVIASMHTCGQKDIHNGDFFVGKTPKESYRQYYEELYFCAKNFNNFNVLGHLDLLKRYSNHIKTLESKQFFDIIEELFKNIIYRGKGIEVNTSGLRSSVGTSLPSIDVLKLYKSLGGEIITLGSDSHFTEHLAYKFPEVLDTLKSIGFKYTTSFEKQKPVFIKI